MADTLTSVVFWVLLESSLKQLSVFHLMRGIYKVLVDLSKVDLVENLVGADTDQFLQVAQGRGDWKEEAR